MSEQEENFAEILYNRLSICKRFPINQVIKITFPVDEVYSNMSIAVVKGYRHLDKDIDNLKTGEFVLEVESISVEKEPFKKYLINPEKCTPINEEIYLSSLNDNSEKSSFIKERLLISDEIHNKNLDIVKEFRLGSVVEVMFKLTNKNTEQEEVKYLLGKTIGYVHIFENEEYPGLFDLQLELFHMQNELSIYGVNQTITVSPNNCKVI